MKRKFTDQELIDGLQTKQGPTVEAITRFLYDECQESIGRMVRKNSGSETDGEDLFQEVIVAFLQNVWDKKFELRPNAKVTTYIYEIGHTMWIKELNKRAARANRTDQFGRLEQNRPDVPSPEQELMNTEEVRSARAIFERLCNDCQKLLKAFYFDKMTMKQIADTFALGTEDNAKTRKYRCVLKLKLLMTP